MNFVVWGTEERSVPCVCSIRFMHRLDHSMNEYLHHFVATRNTKPSDALDELGLVVPGCRIDQFSRFFCLQGCVC